MTINKWVLGLSMWLAALSFLVGAGSQFTDLGMNPNQVKAVIALFVILLGIGNSVNSVLTAFGMTTSNKVSIAQTLPPQEKLNVVHELPLETRAQSFASDPGVAKVVLTSNATANSVTSEKVVGPAG